MLWPWERCQKKGVPMVYCVYANWGNGRFEMARFHTLGAAAVYAVAVRELWPRDVVGVIVQGGAVVPWGDVLGALGGWVRGATVGPQGQRWGAEWLDVERETGGKE